MKKITALVLILVMLLGLAGCGKSQAVKDAEAAISAIGEVGIDSEELILKAEKLYNILTDSEKSDVSNRLELVEARETFDSIQKELVYENAKKAYETLNEAADICFKGMDDIYGAWYFGIYKRSKVASYENIFEKLAAETPHFSKAQLEEAAENFGTMLGLKNPKDAVGLLIKADWQYCLQLVEVAIMLRGDYDTIDSLMKDAQSILQELTGEYADYKYYPKLKEYYATVSSYAEFFKSPTGSFEQLKDTINNYENNIRTYQTDVGFLF